MVALPKAGSRVWSWIARRERRILYSKEEMREKRNVGEPVEFTRIPAFGGK